jgi:hypothetical protein
MLTPLPKPTRGQDVLAQETSLPTGAVRRAQNVVLGDDGSFWRRPGPSELIVPLEGAHSVWYSPAQGRVFCAAEDQLYEVHVETGSHTSLFVGLVPGAPVEYCELGEVVYFASRGLLGKVLKDGRVRRPGVANLMGFKPTLSATVGGLLKGRYGVAYSLTNDLGEESGLSSIEWIELPNGGGITVDSIVQASNAASLNVYVTAPGGSELALNQTVAWTPITGVRDQTRTRSAMKMHRDPLPGGEFVRVHRGRLYVACGNWIYVSDPFDHGVYNVKSGWVMMPRKITMLEPVAGGIFVGSRSKVHFLRGTGPEDFEIVEVFERGAIAHTGGSVDPTFFSEQVVTDRGEPDAVWLSEKGLIIGHPDGSVTPVQASRISMDAGDVGRAGFIQQSGTRQAIFCVESMAMGVGGAVDSTL